MHAPSNNAEVVDASDWVVVLRCIQFHEGLLKTMSPSLMKAAITDYSLSGGTSPRWIVPAADSKSMQKGGEVVDAPWYHDVCPGLSRA